MHVVIMVQENHTTDNYLHSMAAYGANVATGWPVAVNPPKGDQPHDRRAYFRWLTHQITGAHVQFDTLTALPFYAYLGATGALLENHCSGFGTNSTPNHLLLVGGQSPTLRNPPRALPQPLWDMPSVPALAGDHGLTWRGYTGRSQYPLDLYTQLKGSPNIHAVAQFAADAAAGALPALSYIWHDSPLDEHPPANVTLGMNAIWQAVDAVVRAGLWNDTVFMLTWDDWGGYDDHVATPNVEVGLDGVQVAYGPRVPLLMFGGHVRRGIDSRWCSHVSVPKTAIQLLGLPALGVARLDNDAGLADLVDPTQSNPPPPAFGTAITQPAVPHPTPRPKPVPPPPVHQPAPIGPVILRGGGTLPPPNDAPVH
ncbi:MAG TPA: alkaline phosphatase family protein [Chloroflexota bacterium]|jgi:phospholipase C|nr:alkaline phosphatase family protein [Chloroflexota bacterium]